MKTKTTSQSGFTIVELLVATVVFAGVLLILTAGMIVITNNYFAGLIINRSQTATRTIMSDMTQSFQFAAGNSLVPSLPAILSYTNNSTKATTDGFCIGTEEFNYLSNYELTNSFNNPVVTPTNPNATSENVLIEFSNPSCTSSTTPLDLSKPNTNWATSGPGGISELMGPDMSLQYLTVTPFPTGCTSLCTYNIDIQVAYGGTSDLTAATAPAHGSYCSSNDAIESCHVSEMDTQVIPRIGLSS
ncbi:MAG TPA: type II secretion system protein [Candidatus Saccharimonadales bacterium]|nr:type II secretion system protein [Candidatus Saccharimonadales bacterium]